MDLIEAMKQRLNENTPSSGVVLAEFDTTSTELHNIANGKLCTLFDGQFGIRFLLKESFKSGKSSFVINKFKIQFLVSDKPNAMRKENIATKVKVVKGQSKVVKKKEEFKPQLKLQVDDKKEEIF